MALVFIALAIRNRIVRRRKAEQRALLAAGSSAYSMVPVPDDQTASEPKFDRLSAMFSNEPTRLSHPSSTGSTAPPPRGPMVYTTPMLSPQPTPHHPSQI